MSGTIVSLNNKREFSQSKYLIDMGIKTCDSCGTITSMESKECKKCGELILIINE
jgi:rRNA maturation endonuclease Nob1